MESDGPWRASGAAAADSAGVAAAGERAEDLLLLLLRQRDVLLLHGLQVLHQVLQTLPRKLENKTKKCVIICLWFCRKTFLCFKNLFACNNTDVQI